MDFSHENNSTPGILNRGNAAWIQSNVEFKKTPCIHWISFAVVANIGDEGDDNNTANTVSSSIMLIAESMRIILVLVLLVVL